jgi:hypothetical protein
LTVEASSFQVKRGSFGTRRQWDRHCAQMVVTQTLITPKEPPACHFHSSPQLRHFDGGTLSYKLPAQLAHWVYITDGSDRAELTPGSIDVDYPFGCPPGVVGASNASMDQSGPQCSHICPEGYYCPLATTVPLHCILGNYCPLGSPVPLDCMAGTMGTRHNLTSAAECDVCAAGTSCAAGSLFAEPCKVGRFAPNSSSATCTSCSAGMHQDREGQTSCKRCPQGALTKVDSAQSLCDIKFGTSSCVVHRPLLSSGDWYSKSLPSWLVEQ